MIYRRSQQAYSSIHTHHRSTGHLTTLTAGATAFQKAKGGHAPASLVRRQTSTAVCLSPGSSQETVTGYCSHPNIHPKGQGVSERGSLGKTWSDGVSLRLKTERGVYVSVCRESALVDAVRSSLCVELRLCGGRRAKDGTVRLPVQALVWLWQVFP